MKRLLGILTSFIFFILLLKPSPVSAEIINAKLNPSPVYSNSSSLTITITSDSDFFKNDTKYSFEIWASNERVSAPNDTGSLKPRINPVYKDPRILEASFSLQTNQYVSTAKRNTVGNWTYAFWEGERHEFSDATQLIRGTYYIYPPCDSNIGCPEPELDASNFKSDSEASVYIVNAKPNTEYTLWFDGEQTALRTVSFSQSELVVRDGFQTGVARINVGRAQTSPKFICLSQSGTIAGSVRFLNCDFKTQRGITVISFTPTDSGAPIEGSIDAGVPTGTPRPTSPPPPPPCKVGFDENGKITRDREQIVTCSEIETALGNISTDPAGFIRSIFSILLSLAGGIALLIIIVSGYRLMSSQGNPEKVQAAREQLTSAIVGLLFIIFSLSILTIIGVDILRIPRFER